jgi:hypothetical protein
MSPSTVAAKTTRAPALLRISTTVMVSISSNPGASATRTFFIVLFLKEWIEFQDEKILNKFT